MTGSTILRPHQWHHRRALPAATVGKGRFLCERLRIDQNSQCFEHSYSRSFPFSFVSQPADNLGRIKSRYFLTYCNICFPSFSYKKEKASAMTGGNMQRVRYLYRGEVLN